jgi:hypothetical protein
MLLLLPVAYPLFLPSARADCIDYGSNLHWVSSLRAREYIYDVVIAGSYAYVPDVGGELYVVDISDHGSPQVVGSVAVPSIGCVAAAPPYVCYCSEDWANFGVIDVSDPRSPHVVGRLHIPDFHPVDVVVRNGGAYVADYNYGIWVIDLWNPAHPYLYGGCPTPGEPQALDLAGDYAFLADGSAGLEILSLADPGSPGIVARMDTVAGASEVATSGATAYVGNGTFWAIDIASPANPHVLGSMAPPHGTAHIKVADGRAFVTASTFLDVIDVTDPRSPTYEGAVGLPFYAHELDVSGGYAYVADAVAGLQVFDVTHSPGGPLVANMSWPEGETRAVAAFGTHAYVAEEQEYECSFRVIDVTDPTHPEAEGSVTAPSSGWGVAIAGTHAYLADAAAGLVVIDIADPMLPQIVGMVDTPGDAVDVALSTHYAYVADGRWLHVIDIADPLNPLVVGGVDALHSARAIAYSDGYAYVADELMGLKVIDVSDPANPSIVAVVPTQLNAHGVAVSGGRVYVSQNTWSYGEFLVADVSDPLHPVSLDSIDLPFPAERMVVSFPYAYVACSTEYGGSLAILDVSDPEHVRFVGSVDTAHKAYDVALSGEYAYIAGLHSRLQIASMQCQPAALPGMDAAAGSTLQITPNPSVSGTAIELEVRCAGLMRGGVYDATGRLVRTLSGAIERPGMLDLPWDGRDDAGRAVGTGVYLLRLSTAGETTTGRVVVLR